MANFSQATNWYSLASAMNHPPCRFRQLMATAAGSADSPGETGVFASGISCRLAQSTQSGHGGFHRNAVRDHDLRTTRTAADCVDVICFTVHRWLAEQRGRQPVWRRGSSLPGRVQGTRLYRESTNRGICRRIRWRVSIKGYSPPTPARVSLPIAEFHPHTRFPQFLCLTAATG